MPPGRLYLLPASIGDDGTEILLPAAVLRQVRELDYFIAENARSARAELKRIGIDRPLHTIEVRQLPRDPTPAELDALLAPLRAGRSAALMSEAGAPAVADPGARLVAAAHEQELTVVPLVGPSSLLLALMASGLNGQCFAFHGYLPVREPQRRRRICELERQSRRQGCTQIFIETPYRNGALFEALTQACQPDTRLCIATELTTARERITTKTIRAWRAAPPPDLTRRPTVFLLLAG